MKIFLIILFAIIFLIAIFTFATVCSSASLTRFIIKPMNSLDKKTKKILNKHVRKRTRTEQLYFEQIASEIIQERNSERNVGAQAK